MSNKRDFDKSLRKILFRKWVDLPREWFGFVHNSWNSAGMPPIIPLGDLDEMIEIRDAILPDLDYSLNVWEYYFEEGISSIREIVLWEAIFLLHKSSHVLSEAHNCVSNGKITWGISNSYQAAFFAAKAVIQLLGVGIVTYNNHSFMVDCMPNGQSDAKSKRFKRRSGINIIVVDYLLQHRQIWQLLQKMLNSTAFGKTVFKSDVADIISQMKSIDHTDFAKQRNKIHYWNDAWLFDDLHKFLGMPKFGVYPSDPYTKLSTKNFESDFTFIVASFLVRLGIKLVSDIGKNGSGLIKNESEILTQFSSSFHILNDRVKISI